MGVVLTSIRPSISTEVTGGIDPMSLRDACETLLAPFRRVMRKMRSGYSIALDYPIHPRARYGYGKPVHALLFKIIDARRDVYRRFLENLLIYKSDLWRIGNSGGGEPLEPVWTNGFLSGLDAASLYALIRMYRPRLYIEIGSGHSTRFARRAIQDEKINTTIVSIDPAPGIGIQKLADRIIQKPVEDMDLGVFESLQSGDILFVDHSHRVFTNSDSTVVFLDILPKLHPGVLVHFHDVFLPADYPPEWQDRYYAEQYLLACYLLARTDTFEILLANSFISGDSEFAFALSDLWDQSGITGVERHGCSFWVRIKANGNRLFQSEENADQATIR
jgi:predicted O-methyltransferase YrrM